METNALVTIFVQKSITTFTRPTEDKQSRLSPHLVIAEVLIRRKLRGRVAIYLVKKNEHFQKKTLLTEEDVEMWLQHLSDENKVQRKPLQQDGTRIKVTPKGVPRKYRSFVGNDVFYFCGQGEYGEMIACDSPICPVEWFHLDCLGLSHPRRVED